MSPPVETSAFRSLIERRSIDSGTPRGTIYDVLRPLKDDPDIFISFRTMERIGINPKSEYDTPIGVYSVPIGARASSGLGAVPGRSWTKAFTTSPRSGSGAPIAAASATAGWRPRHSSTSPGPIR